MGMGVAGLAVLGLGGLFIILKMIFAPDAAVDSKAMEQTIEILTGFSLGAESIALFARVGGGIYTKAADVGADLVGKVEAGIPEDDPRNPATSADVVPRLDCAKVAKAGEEREKKEAGTRARLQKGELGLDIYDMRKALAEKGLKYVDGPLDD